MLRIRRITENNDEQESSSDSDEDYNGGGIIWTRKETSPIDDSKDFSSMLPEAEISEDLNMGKVCKYVPLFFCNFAFLNSPAMKLAAFSIPGVKGFLPASSSEAK